MYSFPKTEPVREQVHADEEIRLVTERTATKEVVEAARGSMVIGPL